MARPRTFEEDDDARFVANELCRPEEIELSDEVLAEALEILTEQAKRRRPSDERLADAFRRRFLDDVLPRLDPRRRKTDKDDHN